MDFRSHCGSCRKYRTITIARDFVSQDGHKKKAFFVLQKAYRKNRRAGTVMKSCRFCGRIWR